MTFLTSSVDKFLSSKERQFVENIKLKNHYLLLEGLQFFVQ